MFFKNIYIKTLAVILLLFSVFENSLSAETSYKGNENSISVYNGFLTPKDVSEFISTPPSFRSEYLAAGGYIHNLFNVTSAVCFQGEVLGAVHYGSQVFNEYVVAIYLRYSNIINDKYIITGAVGDGISYTEEILHHEHRRNRKSTHYINYLGIEASFGLIDFPVNLVLRLHHRSSAYGLIMNGNTDSNYICIGIRYNL